MIRADSRYADAALYTVDGRVTIDPRSILESRRFEYSTYHYRESDRLDTLAQRFKGDPRQWWRLSEANPENLYPEPDPGQRMRIPHGTALRD